MGEKNRRCGNCGSPQVARKPRIGPFPWKDYPWVYLEKPLNLYGCEVCGESMGPASDSEKIDQAVEESVRVQVRRFVETICEREGCKQVELAERLGVTPEFLSNIKTGLKTPAFQTFNFLKLLALSKQSYVLAHPKVNPKVGQS